MKLPEKVIIDRQIHTGYVIRGYTEAQMREMYQQGLEDAAQACRAQPDSGSANQQLMQDKCIKAILKLEEQSK